MWAGGFAPNQSALKAALLPARSVVSRKITDSPGAMLVMPCKATALPKACESSSIFHPVMFAVAVPMFVTSNQSTRRLVGPDAGPPLPLDHGATSEMMRLEAPPVEAVTVTL